MVGVCWDGVFELIVSRGVDRIWWLFWCWWLFLVVFVVCLFRWGAGAGAGLGAYGVSGES